MTAAELIAEHDRLCDPSKRVGRPWKRAKSTLIERVARLREAAQPLDDRGSDSAKAEATEDAPATVGELVRRLLLADGGSWSYDRIVDEVRRRFPDARTTRRSVASVAADMRKQGTDVARRRK